LKVIATGGAASNTVLPSVSRRADAAGDLLVTPGVPAGELKTVGCGRQRPIDPGHDDEFRTKSRRARLAWEK
jgi:outer membrane protein OmpA-like peptidoglycan-associated protein